MESRSKAKELRAPLAIAVLASLILQLGRTADAAPTCKSVKGKFTLQPVSGPGCTSAVDICATGSYQGGLSGDSSFTGSSITQTVDTPTTSVVLLTGDNAIETAEGTLLTKDAIALRVNAAGEFAEVDTIVGGTGELLGVTGVLTATGTFTAAGGQGTYRGNICTP